MPEPLPSPGDTPRRGFLMNAAALLVGGVALLGPVVAGAIALVSPLSRKKSDAGTFRRVTTLDSVPADGKAYRFTIVADHDDAWSHYEAQPVGAIYLRRHAEDAPPVAFSSVCPHVGCQVSWKDTASCFHCPCHNASFSAEGNREGDHNPSPRDLDTLAVEIRNGNEVWVDYRVFKGGIADKVAV